MYILDCSNWKYWYKQFLFCKLKKVTGAYSGFIDIFENYITISFFKLRVLHKKHRIALHTFQVERVIIFYYVTNLLTKNYRMPCTNGSFNVRTNNSIFMLVTWMAANTCHINGTKQGLELYNIPFIYIVYYLNSYHTL